MPITALPTPPSRNDPTNFATRADTFLAALPTFATEANALQSDVNTKQTTASTAATNAAASASAASSSASSAASSASSASSSASVASAAAVQLAAFNDIYLGAKAADPTLDNDGNALAAGALYFNTATSRMRVYSGLAWNDAGSSVNGTASRQVYTATAAQTTFAITYDVGFIDVFLNGVKQVSGVDFTATNGSQVVFASGLTAGDVVDMIAYGTFSIADTIKTVQIVSSNTGAVGSRVYVMTASMTLTLPASPLVGETVTVSNHSGTTSCVIARNGNKIMGLSEDMTFDSIGTTITLMYASVSLGWILI